MPKRSLSARMYLQNVLDVTSGGERHGTIANLAANVEGVYM